MTEVIGVDLGGTKVAVARRDGDRLADSVVQPTETSGPEALIEQLVAMVSEQRGEELDGVGIGVPSIVEFATGRVVATTNLPLEDVSLRDRLGERLGVPVFVDNDATVAALAEAHDERMRLCSRHLVMLTIGTGVGGGLVLGGRIYRGATGGAGELGHTLVGMDLVAGVPEPGSFPQRGSLEALAAGRALDSMVRDSARSHPDSALAREAGEGRELTGVDAVEGARAGDEQASELVRRWAQRIGIGVANAINTFDPEEVVIGGGAAQAGELLLEPARQVAAQYVIPGLGGSTTIRLARHGVRAGVLGAALLADHELGDARRRVAHSAATEVPT